ncbi:MAG: ribosomal protein S18-alanine N-acetyltransferase [Thermoprotei archaeon]
MELARKGSESGFTVRSARFSDLNAIIRINRLSLPENYPSYFFEEHLRSFPEAFFVAEVDGQVVGYIMPRVEWGASFFDSKNYVKKGHLVSFAVLEQYRRRGIGTALLSKFMEAMRDFYEVEEVYLEVRVSNVEAIRLYEKFGFQKVKILKHYYADGEDAYLMAVRLKSS